MKILLRIKQIAIPLLSVAFCLILSDCEEEKPQPREYPRLKTLPVFNISDEGATFSADIYSLGTETITEHGFVWGTGSNPDLNLDNRVYLGKPGSVGVFSAEIKTTLKEGTEYYVRPYVKTEEHVVYGPAVTFVSLGSLAPVITGFEPDSAGWGDTLKVKGTNFSWVSSLNVVRLGEFVSEIVSSTDTAISVRVPSSLNLLESSVTVTLAGNTASFSQKKFKLIPPVLKDFNPKQAWWGDTLTLKGIKIFYLSTPPNSVKLGDFNCQIMSTRGDSSVSITIPYELNNISNPLVLSLTGFTLQGKQNFELLAPYFTFAPAEGTWGNTINLTGRFNTISSKNEVFFNTSKATIVSATTAKTMSIKVPDNLGDFETNLIYKVTPFEVASATTFKLKLPEIRSFSPVSGSSGTTVTIKGKYYGTLTPVVKFGDNIASVSSHNDSTIVVTVGKGGYGPVKISIMIGNKTIISAEDFNITNPRITNISPLTGTFNDKITITGDNMVSNGWVHVYFGNIEASIETATPTTIVAYVPISIDSIPQIIKIVTSGNNNASSADYFTLSPHEIYSVTPAVLVGGEDIIITGKGFNPEMSRIQVMICHCPLTVKSATSTQIVATVPQDMDLPRGTFKIKVISGGYTRSSDQTFTCNSKWLYIPSPFLNTLLEGRYYPYPVIGGGLEDFGYLCAVANSGQTYICDPAMNTWTELDGSLNITYYQGAVPKNLVFRDTLYYLYGYKPVMYGIDGFDKTWKTKPVSFDVPVYSTNTHIIMFSLTNKIYVSILKYNSIISYEIDPSDNYSRIRSTDFPGVPNNTAVATSFSIGNKGYVLFSNNNFWQFDIENKEWTQLINFPGTARSRAISFVIDGYGYIGTGVKSLRDETLNDIWRYNPATDSWTFVTNMPNSRCEAVAYTLNGKAYVGYGRKYNLNYTGWRDYYIYLNDFYEFDPNYPLK